MRRLGPPGVAGAESVGVRGNLANMSVSGAEPSPSTTNFSIKGLNAVQMNDVTQNFLYCPFQVEHSSGLVAPGDFKRSLVKYFELNDESRIRAGRVE